jgi:hypothetical protein
MYNRKKKSAADTKAEKDLKAANKEIVRLKKKGLKKKEQIRNQHRKQ